MNEKIITLNKRIEEKFKAIDQNPEVHLEGLVWAKPITYWDYIHTDALLNLQIQRSTEPDEMVFIMYHQINELLFKMMLWEIDQVATAEKITAPVFSDKLNRVSRYFDMLASSFSIMMEGMDVKQYLNFRNTLTPASGFQSAQYRLIEFASTDWINLIDRRFRENFDRNADYDNIYEHLYWQAAGKDHSTGKKTTLVRLFEERYKTTFLNKLKAYNHCNLWSKYKSLNEQERKNPDLVKAMRHYDKTVNITWVMAHYYAAEKYLESDGNTAEATGGSDWKKYMLPKYQRRIFFPELWSADELKNWGENV
ncbi:MAG: tryptophan 2,3-dioxygenase [Bacteroidia bacterium]|nr:tryptophan 2,3-dioxygenase [Bacteroidia bacterium]